MTLSFILADEFGAESECMLGEIETDGAVVPALWDFEVLNGLRSAERRGRINEAGISKALQALAALSVERDRRPVDGHRVISLSREYELSAYDAAYLGLALDRALPLATLDAGLIRAAAAAGVKTNV